MDAFNIVILNRSKSPCTIKFTLRELSLNTTRDYVVRDLWLHQNIGLTRSFWVSEAVPSHGVHVLVLTPV